jgi:cytochrome c oxidase cbb3-type subunit 4
MSAYDSLRHFADSWGLIAMNALFLLLIGWTFRPGARRHLDDAANSIFRSESDD